MTETIQREWDSYHREVLNILRPLPYYVKAHQRSFYAGVQSAFLLLTARGLIKAGTADDLMTEMEDYLLGVREGRS